MTTSMNAYKKVAYSLDSLCAAITICIVTICTVTCVFPLRSFCSDAAANEKRAGEELIPVPYHKCSTHGSALAFDDVVQAVPMFAEVFDWSAEMSRKVRNHRKVRAFCLLIQTEGITGGGALDSGMKEFLEKHPGGGLVPLKL